MVIKRIAVVCVAALMSNGCATTAVSLKADASRLHEFRPRRVVEIRQSESGRLSIIGEGQWSDKRNAETFVARLEIVDAGLLGSSSGACEVSATEIANGYHLIYPSCVELMGSTSPAVEGKVFFECEPSERSGSAEVVAGGSAKNYPRPCVDRNPRSLFVLRSFPEPGGGPIAVDIATFQEWLPPNRWWYALLPLALVADIVTFPVQAIIIIIGYRWW